MHKDLLEQYIEDNRGAFDQVETPDLNAVWSNIPPTKSKRPYGIKLLILALIGLGVICSYFIFEKYTKETAIQHYVMSSEDLYPKKQVLMNTVKEQEQKLEHHDINPSEFEEIYNELDELEYLKKGLETDFEKYGDKEEMIKILFKYYERKSKILELLIKEINKKEKYESIHDQII